ncbi:ATP-binding protein [Bifidobacterium eulemuris]|uniref:ATP-binding protein n=1 Tax=Bifidobacterium eulemuris TaxID=1765219 RepID=A0A261FZK9_9BIFI|nr:ATP-binding protein [Bifidobacterium eulemuris]OZG64611.1 ATPase [Bifidobacterium eulemuris]QOL32371.1 ATP-binding protein [Bifidobacterium eulemuris]
MLKRKALQELVSWKNCANGKEALLIEGARRVGKSTVAQEFGRSEYESTILVDFSRFPKDVRSIFEEQKDDLDTFFMMLSVYYRTQLVRRRSLIIFDEVQLYPPAREMIKHLVADGRYDYVETGSLISIKRNVENILIPSEESKLQMGPMDFEEFCWAMEEDLLADAIREAFTKLKPLPDALHKRAMRMWREYMLVGGMPQVVDAYVANRDFGEADRIKRNILGLYSDDIGKFANGDAGRVRDIFARIPGQLSKHEKKFTLASIDADARSRDYDSAFFWLDDARLVNICRNSTDPTVGLGLYEDNASFKCYMADTGLLVSQTFADRQSTPDEVYRDILFDKLSLNEGMLVENAVAQQLKAAGRRLFFFSRYAKGDAANTMEIDFLIVREYDNAAMKPRVSPVEVKSTKRYGTSSLNKFRKAYGQRLGKEYVLHPRQLQVDGDRISLPLYMSGCL